MADTKLTGLSGFTPVLTDELYGVDDPGGTPVSGKVTLTSLRDLLQANITALTIDSQVTLDSDAANTLALRNSTNAQAFNVYNTYTDASNYERGFLRWNANVFEISVEKGGTGSNRSMAISNTNGNLSISQGGLAILNCGGSTGTLNYIESMMMNEKASAPTGVANKAILFAQDNGAGKTQLMVQFGSGAAQQIAIEP